MITSPYCLVKQKEVHYGAYEMKTYPSRLHYYILLHFAHIFPCIFLRYMQKFCPLCAKQKIFKILNIYVPDNIG